MGPHAIDHRLGEILVGWRRGPLGEDRTIGSLGVEAGFITLEELCLGRADGLARLYWRWNSDRSGRHRAAPAAEWPLLGTARAAFGCYLGDSAGRAGLVRLAARRLVAHPAEESSHAPEITDLPLP